MIGAMSARRRIQIVNAPVTPTFSAPSAMLSTNTLSGSGSFQFQFNATKRTCSTASAGSVSGSGASSFQYFNASDLIDPLDYEVMVTLGTASTNSNITTGGGSATLGVWHTLSTSPLFIFSCSDRRGGTRPVNIEIRHRVDNGVTATTAITLTQSSDAVTPSFTGFGGTTTLTRTTTNSYLGIYIDSESGANAGRIRTYKDATVDANTGFTFNTGSIPESEYEFQFSGLSITPGGSMTGPGGIAVGSYLAVSTARGNSPTSSSGGRFSALDSNPAGVGVMRMTMRHKLDTAKSAVVDKTFQTF